MRGSTVTTLAFAGSFLFTAQLLAQTKEPVVYVRVPVVDALYDDDAASLKLFDSLLSQARVREVKKQPGESINEVIAREYKFGHTETPLAYRRIEESVKTLNTDFTHSTKVLIPDIAPRAWEDFTPTKPANSVPKIAVWDKAQAASVNGETVFMGHPRIVDSGRHASQSMVIEYPVSESQARKWKEDPGFVGQVLNFPLTVRLASDGNATSQPFRVLTDDQTDVLKMALTKAKRDSYLIIADSGWPADDEYKYSIKELTRAINIVRADRLNLGPIALPLPTTLASVPSNTHCISIRDALREFETLDGADRVKVVYIPLTRAQGAAPLLEELIATEYLVDLRISHPSIVKPEAAEEKAAHDFAKNVIAQVPSEWPAIQREVRTDKAVLEAAMRVLNYFAESKSVDVTIFLNESWTAKHDQYYVAFPSPMRGAILAATGNDNEKVNLDLWEFSQRCINNRDTIAVMNFDSNGPICSSGEIDAASVKAALAIGYDGRVQNSCSGGGTSISAPRVGWLLAAGEAVRVKRFNASHWGVDAMDALSAIRAEQTLKGVGFDPAKYLKAALQE